MPEDLVFSDVEDFDEWEDIPLDLEDYQYTIEYSNEPDQPKVNSASELSKLTKCYKTKYLEQSIKFNKLQALFSVIYLKKLLLNNCYRDIKLRSIVPSLIRKKFKKKIDTTKQILTLIKGFILWFEKHYLITKPGQRPIDKRYVRDAVFREWFERNKFKLQELHKNKNKTLEVIERHYKVATNKKISLTRYFGNFPNINVKVEEKEHNTKEEYVFKFFLLLSQLLSSNDKIKIKLMYNVPCLNVGKVMNDCATKNLASILQDNSETENIHGVQRAIDYDLYFPYMWIELHVDEEEEIHYINPLKFGGLQDFLYPISKNKPFKQFIEFDEISPFDIECPQFIFSVDKELNVENCSSRYIPNLQYSVKPCFINLKNELLWTLDKFFWKTFENLYQGFDIKKGTLKVITETYTRLPQKLQDYKRHPNFIIDKSDCYRSFLEIPVGDSIGELAYNNVIYKVYFRSQLQRLRTKIHWQILGRDTIDTEKPRKFKTFRNNRDPYALKTTVPLFTFDQTTPSPRIKSLANIAAYKRSLKGTDMLKIFNKHTMLPKGFILIGREQEVNKKLLNLFNKRHFRHRVDFLEVITGFKFLPKNQIKPVTSFMILESDYDKLKEFHALLDEKEQLLKWKELLLRLSIKRRIDF